MKNYKKPVLTEKIIQFGEGGFLRGFVDWIVQEINEHSDFSASCVVVQPIKNGMCELLESQNCVYTHIMRGIKDSVPTVDKKIIDCISRTVRPYDCWEDYLALAENPDFKIVVSNTTEAGIVYNDEDEMDAAPEVSFPAKLTLLLYKRFSLSLGGFLFLPCELIEQNGDTLRECVLKYAEKWGLGEDFKNWVKCENHFCNTLVDRIVTGYPKDEKIDLPYTDNMLNTSELFHLWVIEGDDEKIKSVFPYHKADLNIIVTDNLSRYRTRKVRILNGAHTSMIPYALLEGIESVGDCMENEKMSAFVKACVYEEIIPTLDLDEDELLSYADDVFLRFKNPFIKHLCSSISLNSVSKFKVRVLPSLLEYIKRRGENPPHLMLSLAKLIEFYKNGNPQDDPEIIDFMKTASVAEILANQKLWGQDLSSLYPALSEIIK